MEGQGLIGMYGRECECVSCEPCRELRGRKRIGAQLAYRCLDRLHLSFQLGLEGSVQDTDRVFQCSPTDPQGSCESHFNLRPIDILLSDRDQKDSHHPANGWMVVHRPAYHNLATPLVCAHYGEGLVSDRGHHYSPGTLITDPIAAYLSLIAERQSIIG